MNFKSITTVITAGVLSLAGANVFAANVDAALAVGPGATSTGNFDLDIYKGDAVSITGMTTLFISGGASPANKTGSINVCTYATTANYQLDINSVGLGPTSSTTPEFDADDGTGLVMPYTIDWNDSINTLVYSDNTDAPSVIGSPNQLDPTCGAAGTNTAITVTVAAVDFNGAAAGTYTDTVEVIITAQ